VRNSIERVLPRGAGWYDAVYVSGRSTPLSFKNNRLHSVSESESSGFGVRVNLDGRTGFSYTNDSDNIDGAVKRSVDMCRYGDRENYSLPGDAVVSFEPYDDDINGFNLQEEINRGEKIIDDLKSSFPGINVDMGIASSTGVARLLNSAGVDVSYKESYYSVSVSCSYIMPDGTRIETWDSRSELKPMDCSFLKNILSGKIEKALHTEKISSGLYP